MTARPSDPGPSAPATPRPLPRTLADKLAAARRARFVGRTDEIACFERMLAGDDEAAVMFVHGPGGIGKTTLLREFARRAEAHGRVVVALDARDVQASPLALRAALAQSLGSELEDVPPGLVLLIDTFELMASLELWLRDALLPELPSDALVVIAGRTPADAQWRTDPGWAALAKVLRLAPLAPAEVDAFLDARDVPEALRTRAAALARGHPLALGVLADALRSGRTAVLDSPAERSGLMRTLLERFLADLNDAESRAAVDTLVIARVVDESMLAAVIDSGRAATLYDKLRRLPFVEDGEHGLFLHDLARESIAEDRFARDPERLTRGRLAISRHLMKAAGRNGVADRQRFFRDWVFLLRTTTTAPFVDERLFEQFYTDRLGASGDSRARDLATMQALARAQAGERTAAMVAHWAVRAPDDVVAIRCRDGTLHAFAQFLRLETLDDEAIVADPVLAAIAAWRRGQPQLGRGPGDCVRFAFDPDPAMPNALSTFGGGVLVERALLRPRRTCSLIVAHDPHVLAPLWDSMPQGISRFNHHEVVTGLAPSLDGRAHQVRVRIFTPAAGEAGFDPGAGSADAAAPALDRDAFAGAVRDGLRNFARTDRLAANPLLGTALLRPSPVSADGGVEAGACAVEALRALLTEAVQALAEHPADLKFHHALRLTWLDPGATQEKVAEELGLPFNTYRYHLGRGLERVVQWMWQRELREVRQA
ncbi:MAG: ATP-binding protein [Burkholderiaceae bacterium]